MRRDLTHAAVWGRSTAHANASETGGLAGRRGRIAVIVALALVGALVLAAPASAFVNVTSFDGSRTPAGSMVPERMSVDLSSGDVYVIDTASDVVDRFNRYGRYLGQLVGSQTPRGTFGFDAISDDVTVDNSSTSTQGNVYVAGEHQGGGPTILTAFSRDGILLWQENSPLTPPTRFGGVAVDPTNGNLWVGDRRSGVYQFSPVDGSLLPNPPIDASSDAPGPMAFDSAGNLYAAALEEPLVELATPITSSSPTTLDPNATFAIATDLTNDDVYVDHGQSILVYDRTGAQDPNSPFASATSVLPGVAVDGAADHIYVANNDTNAVEIWAHVMPPMDQLTVTVDGTGTGRVDADQSAIVGCTSSGGVCTGSYEDGNTVTLTATPGNGMVFAGWSGADAGVCAGTTTDCVVSMDAAKNITATFNAPPQHTLTVSKSGNGSVASSPAGISCGSTCAAPFGEGTSVTLTATADGGSQFSGWTGCDSVSGNRCTVAMTADRNVSATFVVSTLPTHTLSVSKGGDGSGTVTSSPAGISCGAACGSVFTEGTSVTLSAAADAGSTFAGWSGGGCSGTGTCTVSLGSDATVTATFAKVVGSPPPCPQDLSKCPPAVAKLAGFSASSLVLRVKCTGFSGQACSGKLTFKSVIKVRVRHGKKTKVVKKTIPVATVSYRVAAGGTQSLKVKLTSAARTALKSGGLTAKAGSFSIKLPKTKVRKKKKH